MIKIEKQLEIFLITNFEKFECVSKEFYSTKILIEVIRKLREMIVSDECPDLSKIIFQRAIRLYKRANFVEYRLYANVYYTDDSMRNFYIVGEI